MSDGNVNFTVWGFDNFVADVAATAILTTTVPVKPISETYELRFSSEDLDTIEYQSGGEDSLGYYLTFYVDVAVSYTHLRAHETPEPSRMPSSA